MTNSTSKPANAGRTAKRPGPIRTGAVVPTVVIFALVGLYFTFFFDGHLRRGLEYVGTQINGAEVNIGRLSTSFLRANLEMDHIQVTDKNKPTRNILEVGQIRFRLLWDALLRAKVVVNDASILEIQALSPRRSPGYVVPPSPPSKGPSALEKVQDQVLSQTRKTYNENFLGDLASVLGGTDPAEQLKNVQMQLKSDARIKELEKGLAEKKLKWQQRLKELPQADDFKQYEARIKALKFNTKNPSEFAKDLKEADKIRKEIDQKVKLVEQTSRDVRGDVDTYTQAYKDLERMVQEDLRDLQNRLKIPSLNPKEFSQQIFMSMIEQKIAGFSKYMAVAREYMPPKRSAEEKQAKKDEQLVPPKRGAGRNFRFPVTTGYPLFWLKHAALSSELGQSEYSGNIKGEILDLSSDPSYIGRPIVLRAQGDFPKQKIFGMSLKITLDHTTEVPKETLSLSVNSLPIQPIPLSKSKEVRLVLDDAQGSSQIEATLVNQAITMDFKGTFREVKYSLEAKNKVVHEILDGVLKGIPTIQLNAQVRGSLSDFDLNINSNLGDELAKGFQRQLQAKIEDAQKQLRRLIDERIGGQKEKLKAEMDKATGDVTKVLDSKKAEAEKAGQQAKAEGDPKKSGSPEKKLEEEGKKLLKKFGFGKSG